MFFSKKPQRVVHGKGARRHTRYPAISLSCVLGEVLDASQSGLRVRGRGACPAEVGDVVVLAVSSERQRVSASVRVMWRRRAGLRGYELGLAYVDTPRGARAAILQLARYGFVGASAEALEPEAEPGAPEPVRPAAGQPEGGAPRPAVTVEVEDLYAVLGVAAEASEEEIRAAYRAAARVCHPDVCGTPEGAERFALISKAHAVLRDAELRARYDAMRARARAA